MRNTAAAPTAALTTADPGGEKVCFEEQARPAKKKNPLRQLEQELHKAERTVRQAAPRKSHASGKEKASGVIFMAVFIISMLSVMLPSMIRSCQAKIDEGGHGVTVTPAQEEAMKIGSMCGWDVPGADPDHCVDIVQRRGGMELG